MLLFYEVVLEIVDLKSLPLIKLVVAVNAVIIDQIRVTRKDFLPQLPFF